jgi:hypothetical protein
VRLSIFLPLCLLLAATGCQREDTATTPVEPEPTAPQAQSDGIQMITPSPTPLAPVAGAESVQGGGSAAGQIMKDRARNVGGGSSLDQMGGGE